MVDCYVTLPGWDLDIVADEESTLLGWDLDIVVDKESKRYLRPLLCFVVSIAKLTMTCAYIRVYDSLDNG